MYEFTHGGAWFRWSALDRTSKMLATATIASNAVAGILIGMAAKPVSTRFGFDVTQYTAVLALLGVMAAVVTAWFWYRFSVRQDEMFNRLQNWTLGVSGVAACAASTIWSVLATASLVMPMPSFAPIDLFAGANFIFWFIAMRKWVY
ncbi:MAG: hypothetical protein K2Y20_06355 [Sphingomonas sp.]|nr:hypothetical protein [Sphingomonas sp.]